MEAVSLFTDSDGATYLVFDRDFDHRVEVCGPFTACHCRPHCGLPPCTGCGDDHGGHDHGGGIHLCRDCDIEHGLSGMECSACGRMRYRTETPLGNIGGYLWGEPCTCDPRPPSTREASGRDWRVPG